MKPLPSEDLDHVLAHTRDLWAGARGQSFFITGGTGFFGRWLLESFARANDALALGMRAVVLTRNPAAFAQKAPHLVARADLEFVPGDLRTFSFPAGRFPYLIHAAADTAVWTQQQVPDDLLDRTVAETRRVLDFAAGAGLRNFLLLSSGAVYGRQPPELTHIPEDYSGAPDPLLPGSAWGEAKRIAEHVCTQHASRHGYALKIARGFAFVGPHLPLDAHYAIGNFIQDALAGAPIHVSGDGTPRRSYLYAADLAVWLWTLLFAAPSARAYNVGAAVDLSIAELAGLVSQVAGVSGAHPPVAIAGQFAPGRPVSRYVPAVNRAQTELGLRPLIPLPEAIRKTIAWHRSNPAADSGSLGSANKQTS